jgi:hypothetical protein
MALAMIVKRGARAKALVAGMAIGLALLASGCGGRKLGALGRARDRTGGWARRGRAWSGRGTANLYHPRGPSRNRSRQAMPDGLTRCGPGPRTNNNPARGQ